MEERGGESESGRERWEVEEWRRGGEGGSGGERWGGVGVEESGGEGWEWRRAVGRAGSGGEWWGGVGVEESGGRGGSGEEPLQVWIDEMKQLVS